MRTRINNITFTPGTRSITTGITDLTIDDIRLFINESQMKVICSSMQKDNIDSIVSGVVTYKSIFPVLAAGDHITFEIDRGDNVAKENTVTSSKLEILSKIDSIPQPDLSNLATETNATANKQAVLSAIEQAKIALQGNDQTATLAALKTAIAAIDVSDLAKEATLGDVESVLEYIEQGGMPEISAIAKQGTNANANISDIQSKIGTPATGQPTDLFAAIAAGGGGGGTVYPTIQMTETTAAIDPNKVYIWGEVASLDISLNAGEQGVANVYFLEFYSGATATTLTLPASVIDVRGEIGSNQIVNVAIFNGVAYVA